MPLSGARFLRNISPVTRSCGSSATSAVTVFPPTLSAMAGSGTWAVSCARAVPIIRSRLKKAARIMARLVPKSPSDATGLFTSAFLSFLFRKKTIAIPSVEISFPQFADNRPQLTARRQLNDGKFFPQVDESASLEADRLRCRLDCGDHRWDHLLFYSEVYAGRLSAHAAGSLST